MEEYAHVVNVEGVVVRDGEYLLVERSPAANHATGSLAFPGGKVEHPPDEDGDAVEATAVRELREEVGLAVGGVQYVHSRTFEADDGTPCINVVTLCEDVEGEAHPRATDEVTAVHWLPPGAIRAREDVPSFLERDVDRVEALRRNRGG
ncbi:NUDIX hydrolase [Halobacteriales archaeon QS_8_69_26]|nr:MAG: NUDIX hydrolase [Halobacteriales archaeon QS_8_69_26]